MIDNNYSELEYKYRADNIQLQDFLKLMNELKFESHLDISSWDIYYTPKGQKDTENFTRFRMSNTPELTKKIKTKTSNNWSRIEVDIPLDGNKVTEQIVTKFLELEGYEPNFKIYKSCFIFWQNYVNYVYYIVYDENMSEKGRFIEVEVNKNKISKLESQIGGAPWQLQVASKELEKLGLTAQHRLKKSLFELFKK